MAARGTRCTHRQGAGRKRSAYGCARRMSTRRPEHGSMGGAWERGRADGLLVEQKERGAPTGAGKASRRGEEAPASPTRLLGREGTQRKTSAARYRGRRGSTERPREGLSAVCAAQRTEEGGEARPTGPPGGSAARRAAVLAGGSPAGAMPLVAPSSSPADLGVPCGLAARMDK